MDGIKIGSKLLELRKKAGLSQGELADKLGVSRQAVSKWECDESLPDTENLITLARLYGISIDALVGHEPSRQEGDPTDASGNASNGTDGKADGGEDANRAAKTIRVSIGDDEDDDDDEEAEAYYSYDDTPADKKRKILRALHALPFPILAGLAFFLWGFLWDGWGVAWTLFILIPVYYSILDCFRKKRLSSFAFPVFIAFVYCLIGMQWGLWHPHWLVFLTVPIYYAIAGAIDKSRVTTGDQRAHKVDIEEDENGEKISVKIPGIKIKINKNESEK